MGEQVSHRAFRAYRLRGADYAHCCYLHAICQSRPVLCKLELDSPRTSSRSLPSMISHMTSRWPSCRPHASHSAIRRAGSRERYMVALAPRLSLSLRTPAARLRTRPSLSLGAFHNKSAPYSTTLHRTSAMSPPEKKQRTEEYILYYVRLIWGSSSGNSR